MKSDNERSVFIGQGKVMRIDIKADKVFCVVFTPKNSCHDSIEQGQSRSYLFNNFSDAQYVVDNPRLSSNRLRPDGHLHIEEIQVHPKPQAFYRIDKVGDNLSAVFISETQACGFSGLEFYGEDNYTAGSAQDALKQHDEYLKTR